MITVLYPVLLLLTTYMTLRQNLLFHKYSGMISGANRAVSVNTSYWIHMAATAALITLSILLGPYYF